MEDHVHHHLEGGWGISESEERNCWLKESLRGEEHGFPLISFFYADIIIPPSYIKFGKEGTASEAINGLRDKRRDVVILLGPTVDRSVVLDGTKFAIFLFDKEEVGGIRAPRFLDGPSPEVFSYKFVNFLYLELGDRE